MTVADDLLKNDGQKFLEMMEQLAERRMQREEEAAVDVEDDSEDEDDEGIRPKMLRRNDVLRLRLLAGAVGSIGD